MKKVICLLLPVLLTACAYPSIGDKQGDVPPRIVQRGEYKTWDNPGAFGPVPRELQAMGDKICSSLNTDKVKHRALGYHAKAEDLQGKPFVGGGYYCVPQD